MRLLATWILLLLSAASAAAQLADFDRDRVPMAQLAGPWRFHTGDNPAWASAGFDDSSWSLLAAGKPWSEQGYRGYTGTAWYRLRVTLPAHPGQLALYLQYVVDSYQVFANGQLIGQSGGMPPHPRYDYDFLKLYRIPADAVAPGQPLELAIRVWQWPGSARIASGGLLNVPRLGDAEVLEDYRALDTHNIFWYNAENVLDTYLNFLTGLAGVGLFLLRRKEREYLLWGVSQLCWGIFSSLSLVVNFFPTPHHSLYALLAILFAVAQYLQNEFYVILLRQRRRWLFWGAAGFILLNSMFMFWGGMSPGHPAISFADTLTGVLQHFCMVGMLWIGFRRRHPDALFLLVPNALMLAAQSLAFVVTVPILGTFSWAGAVHRLLSQPSQWPFPISLFSLLGTFEMFAVLIILVRSYARSRRDEERLEAELEAARVVQQVLIPTDIPTIPGFILKTAYKPASEVGGDFFQIMPLERGGALIAVGDVSGKGMPAAMTVSLLVGTLRTLAHYTQSPAEILRAMNVRMLSRSHGGFTTCLVLRLDPDGTLTAANAGHLAPYIGGHEAHVENGLPLGLSPDAFYAETVLHLGPGQPLTLLTDGVLEARSRTGELFGFDRTTAISTQSAESIARAAQDYGQEDDITVLTLTAEGTPVAA